jgi:hypothetical protein
MKRPRSLFERFLLVLAIAIVAAVVIYWILLFLYVTGIISE